MFNRSLLKAALLVCASVPVINFGLASAQTVNVQGSSAQKSSYESVRVALVRQDFSDCVNSNVIKKAGSHGNVGGFISMTKNPHDGELQMKVSIFEGTPNTKYNVFLKCKQQIGYVKTNKNGVGSAYLSAPLSIVPSVFAFDMYPDGAPSGNKFQSVQVKY